MRPPRWKRLPSHLDENRGGFTSAIRHRMSRGFDETESFRDSFLPLYVETPPLPDTESPVTYCQIDLPTVRHSFLSFSTVAEVRTILLERFVFYFFFWNEINLKFKRNNLHSLALLRVNYSHYFLLCCEIRQYLSRIVLCQMTSFSFYFDWEIIFIVK